MGERKASGWEHEKKPVLSADFLVDLYLNGFNRFLHPSSDRFLRIIERHYQYPFEEEPVELPVLMDYLKRGHSGHLGTFG